MVSRLKSRCEIQRTFFDTVNCHHLAITIDPRLSRFGSQNNQKVDYSSYIRIPSYKAIDYLKIDILSLFSRFSQNGGSILGIPHIVWAYFHLLNIFSPVVLIVLVFS